MAYRRPPDEPPRPQRTTIIPEPAEEKIAEPELEQRVAITLGVADGFKLGCGLILAGVTFYFALIMVVAVAFLFAMLLNLPLPFGLGR